RCGRHTTIRPWVSRRARNLPPARDVSRVPSAPPRPAPPNVSRVPSAPLPPVLRPRPARHSRPPPVILHAPAPTRRWIALRPRAAATCGGRPGRARDPQPRLLLRPRPCYNPAPETQDAPGPRGGTGSMERRRLGRGLDALLGGAGDGAAGPDGGPIRQARLPVEHLDRNPFQPRKEFDPEELAAL